MTILPGFGVRMRGLSGNGTASTGSTASSGASLGDVRKVSLEDARKIARQRFAQVELGTDPAAERHRLAQALTLGGGDQPLSRGQQDRLRPNTFKAAELFRRSLEGRCTIVPSTPSSGRTWPRGCKSSSRRTEDVGGAGARHTRRCTDGR
jgi:hypothetical protein